jgi:DNA repair exonuclease SbcCD nuclease subunit
MLGVIRQIIRQIILQIQISAKKRAYNDIFAICDIFDCAGLSGKVKAAPRIPVYKLAANMDKGAQCGHHARMAFRFVHSADIHLDSPLRSLALRNREVAELVGGASRRAFERIVDLCLEERVDALILAGDLFDGELRSMKTAAFFSRQTQRLAAGSIEVYMVRGNHDSASRLTQLLHLPDNVHVFSSRGETFLVEEKNVALHGVSFGRKKERKSLLPKFPAPVEGMINIGVLHTSLSGAGLAGASNHDVYAPCSARELLETGYDYWALGHIHKRSVIEKKGCAIVMPGIPQGRHINEDGAKSATLAAIENGAPPRLSEHFLAPASFERISVDLAGAGEWKEMLDLVKRAVKRRLKRNKAETMIMRLDLFGATPLNSRLRRNHEYLDEEIAALAQECGSVFCEKISVRTSHVKEAGTREKGKGQREKTCDPLRELRDLASSPQMFRNVAAGEFSSLLENLHSALPPELRGAFDIEDNENNEDAIAAMLEGGLEEVLARLEEEAREA